MIAAAGIGFPGLPLDGIPRPPTMRYAAPSRTIATEWIDEPRRRWQWYIPESVARALRQRCA